ncbi:MAG: ABC transporter ATP-binding protein [Candidatus Dojkabacteria bacterium]|jgi:ABC-2 type transport system ATP-binding protein
MKKVIEVQNLTKRFSVEKRSGQKFPLNILKRKYEDILAVNNISFDINKGEFVGFIGCNGAGKTTTLKCLCGLLSPDDGEVNVLGYRPVERSHDLLKRMSLVMGNKSQLWWDLPSVDTFLLNKEVYEIDDKEYEENLNMMVDVLGIKNVVDIPVRKLSLGERMKCELAASLLHFPEVVFLDEPTIGLDVFSQQALRNFLKEYRKERNATIVLTSHNMEDVTNLCERVLVIDSGEIIYDGKLDELTKSFVKKKYVKFLLKKEVKVNEISKIGEVVSFNGMEGVVAVDRENITNVLAKFLKEFEVIDIDVEEPSLEDVVRKIFKSAKESTSLG